MMRVLVVAHEPEVARALASVLEREGFAVTVCEDGIEALQRLGDRDLVIVDLALPGLAAFEIAASAVAKSPRPKVCALTEGGRAADRACLEAMGVDAFVTKPPSEEDLMDAVRALIGDR